MNKAILIGRLTKDPELKSTTNNNSVCRFTLAIDRRYTNSAGEREADFIPVVTWRKTAEFAGRYFKKGMRVAVAGNIQSRKWEDAEGKSRVSIEVVADELEFADSKKESSGDGSRYNRNNVPDVKPGGFLDGDSVTGDDFEESASGSPLPFDF